MEFSGRIIACLEARSGEARDGGKWVVQPYVIESVGEYSKKICFEVSGEERIKRFGIKIGQLVKIFFSVDANEWQGRWFNQIRAYDVRPLEQTQYQTPEEAAANSI